ncbi:AI-2E family transporter [Nocardia sp. NPDC057353]|uniref:AI-2E family transporter n=1 Tax=Nocardia sp. NPDC057353 TaxID=3346104 RepID=UPI003635A5B3
MLSGGPGCVHYLADRRQTPRGMRTWCPEPRGVGRSGGGPHNLRQAVADLEAVRRAAGIEGWVVAGHSWGSDLAVRYALDHPERVRAVVGIAGHGLHKDRYWKQAYESSTLAHYVAMRVLDVPSAFALALWVGVVSQFVPTVGTYLAGALPVLVALVYEPVNALWLLGFIVLYQQFENYVLQPRVTATTLDMHPAVAFGAVIAGAALLGPTGALLAIPVTATVQGFAGAYIRRYEVRPEAAVTPDPPTPARRLGPCLTHIADLLRLRRQP